MGLSSRQSSTNLEAHEAHRLFDRFGDLSNLQSVCICRRSSSAVNCWNTFNTQRAFDASSRIRTHGRSLGS